MRRMDPFPDNGQLECSSSHSGSVRILTKMEYLVFVGCKEANWLAWSLTLSSYPLSLLGILH